MISPHSSPHLSETGDEVVRPRGEYVLLHCVSYLFVVAEEHGWPGARVEAEYVAVLLLVIVQDLHWGAAEDVHVANEWEAMEGILFIIKKDLQIFYKVPSHILTLIVWNMSSMMLGAATIWHMM